MRNNTKHKPTLNKTAYQRNEHKNFLVIMAARMISSRISSRMAGHQDGR